MKYSVVIPLYNKAHTIEKTLFTVINQTCQDFEIVIVNDGSTDSSVDIVRNKFNDPRIKIIEQENQGVSVARNRGVEESNGDYIAFLDADDEWHPDYLQKISEMIDLYPSAGLYLTGGFVKNADETISYRLVSKFISKISQINLFESPELYTHTSASVYRKSVLVNTHMYIPQMRKYEDIFVACKVALKANVVYCGIPLSKYNGGIAGQLTQENKKNKSIALKSMSIFFNQLLQEGLENPQQTTYVIRYLKYLYRHTLKLAFLSKDVETVNFYIKETNCHLQKYISKIEKATYRMHIMAVLYIDFTKLIYRCYGYPIVGSQQIDENKILDVYKNWK